MSTLEKAINLLQIMPEQQLESVYMYMRFVHSQSGSNNKSLPKRKDIDSVIGSAHEYANPKLIPLEKEAFANAMAEKHAIN